MNALEHCFLYGFIDLTYVRPEEVPTVTQQLVRGGVDVLQLRAKQAAKEEIARLATLILPITRPASVPLIINDHPDLLQTVDAEGCHVGQDDYSVEEARRLAGRPVLVGKSTHTLEQALAAEKAGADYIGFGPIFGTQTKPGAEPVGLSGLKRLHNTVHIPIYCIGGINYDNMLRVTNAGALRVAIVSDILLAENRVDHTRALKSDLG
jgi:thiamine-phosphate pyrophosphorylase